jgi:hypothetical protein
MVKTQSDPPLHLHTHAKKSAEVAILEQDDSGSNSQIKDKELSHGAEEDEDDQKIEQALEPDRVAAQNFAEKVFREDQRFKRDTKQQFHPQQQ